MAGAMPSFNDAIDTGSDSPLSAAVTERDRNVISLVERAVKRRDVLLAFQPVVQAARPMKPVFFEGLIRVIDPTGRIIPARDFFPTVETRELGREIDCLALGLGLDALKRDPMLRLSVNMSARSIGYPRFVHTLRRGLRDCPTAGRRLILEISESSAMMMPELVTTFMASLQIDGVTFAIDNFGSGNTSFKALREFYFDMIKIDGEFIRGIADSPDSQVLTQAMLAVARQFDMVAVAESVETQRDAEFLLSIGIDCMQGYFLGAPTVTPPCEMPGAK